MEILIENSFDRLVIRCELPKLRDSDELVKLAHHFANFGKTLENSISKDLDDEIRHWKEHYIKVKELGFQIDLKDIEVIAKYFAEWGKMQ